MLELLTYGINIGMAVGMVKSGFQMCTFWIQVTTFFCIYLSFGQRALETKQ